MVKGTKNELKKQKSTRQEEVVVRFRFMCLLMLVEKEKEKFMHSRCFHM